MTFAMRMTAAIIVAISVVLVVGTFQLPPVDSIQRGYRGTGMVELYHPAAVEALANANLAPEASPPQPPSGQLQRQPAFPAWPDDVWHPRSGPLRPRPHAGMGLISAAAC